MTRPLPESPAGFYFHDAEDPSPVPNPPVSLASLGGGTARDFHVQRGLMTAQRGVGTAQLGEPGAVQSFRLACLFWRLVVGAGNALSQPVPSSE